MISSIPPATVIINPYTVTPPEKANDPNSLVAKQQAEDKALEVSASKKDRQDTKNVLSSNQATQQSEDKLKQDLTAQELIKIQDLKRRDLEVKNHEQAHKNVAGSIASGMSFDFEVGPDGVRYAVGGEVKINTSKIAGDPEATLHKADMIKRAAMAPAHPSAQDRKVAIQATRMEAAAKLELVEMQRAESDPEALQSSVGRFFDQMI